MPILLSGEEIDKLTKPSPYETYFSHYPHIVAQAQLKKVVEWGNEECPHEKPLPVTICNRFECPYCWQSLKQEAGLT